MSPQRPLGAKKPAPPQTFPPARTGEPMWALGVLALLFVPAIWVHEPVFGMGAGLRSAGAGVVVGLALAAASTRWRWDTLTTVAALISAHLVLGGAAALPDTMVGGVIPTLRTLQLLLVQPVFAWKDLLTITPPAASYTGPAVMPWVVGLVCALSAGVLTVRGGRVVAGTAPIALMSIIGIAWGESASVPLVWPVALWAGAVLAWWAWSAQRRRVSVGEEVIVGRRALHSLSPSGTGASATTTARRVVVVHQGQRIAVALLTIALAQGVSMPLTQAWGPWNSRVVLRDVINPPLDIHDYPTPLSAFRHYTTDLEDRTLITVSALPEGSRVRIAVMDTYNGVTFGMSDPATTTIGGYARAGSRLPEPAPIEGATNESIQLTTIDLVGPWVPIVGIPSTLTFQGEGADARQDGLHLNQWADAALTTGPAGSMIYTMDTMVPPVWSDGQLQGLPTPPIVGTPDTNVPTGVADLAQEVAATEQTPLARARAIERYLSREGFFSNEDTAQSRPGHRADRLARMLDAEQMIGDDEQYASLMALMLHSLGMPARVVMGAYPDSSSGGPVELLGGDIHVWVEIQFDGIGWARFDPTPPKDQIPQTDVPTPRSIPRPQVLQPPDPPEDPVQLPPALTDRGADSGTDELVTIPWMLIGVVSGAVFILIAPIAIILALKAGRRRKRRLHPDPARAVAGSWEEVLDLAADSGVRVPEDFTRQESAWMLADVLWSSPIDEGDASSADPSSASAAEDPGRAAPTSSPVSHWETQAEAVPTAVALARRADTAQFAEEGATTSDVGSAWSQAGRLKRQLDRAAGPWRRVRRALSLRSIRRRRRAARRGRRGRR